MSLLSFRRRRLGTAALLPLVLGGSLFNTSPARGQQSVPVSSPPVISPSAPLITLVEPAKGEPIPQDRPIVVFHLASRDSADGVDARSFVLTVDDSDRTALFRSTRQMAVGFFSPDSATSAPILGPGDHQLHAHVCSMRGVCTQLDTAVTVVRADVASQAEPIAPADSSAGGGSPTSLIRMLLELVLALARKLIGPA